MKWFIVWLVGMAVLWCTPCAIDTGLAHTPDVLTAHADAGTFVSSTASGDTTTIQTTDGSIVVAGAFSSPRGQRLVLERRLKTGLQLCTVDSPVCAPLAGPWPSRLHPVPFKRPVLAFLVPWQASLPSFYFMATLYSFAWSLVVLGALGLIIRSRENGDGKKNTEREVSDVGKMAS